MRWRITLELAGADDTWQLHEIGAGERPQTGQIAATLGLGLAEGKALLAALQRHLVAAQVDEHCRDRRRCDRCGAQRPLKDLRPRRLTSLFGVVAVQAPRFGPCRCGVACRRSITPVAEIMPDRCSQRGLHAAEAVPVRDRRSVGRGRRLLEQPFRHVEHVVEGCADALRGRSPRRVRRFAFHRDKLGLHLFRRPGQPAPGVGIGATCALGKQQSNHRLQRLRLRVQPHELFEQLRW